VPRTKTAAKPGKEMAGATKGTRSPGTRAVSTSLPDDLATGSSAPSVAGERQLERALGAEIRMLRRERDLSVADLASAADISTGMLSKIENGVISPSLSTIQAVAAALHVPFTSLFSSSRKSGTAPLWAKARA